MKSFLHFREWVPLKSCNMHLFFSLTHVQVLYKFGRSWMEERKYTNHCPVEEPGASGSLSFWARSLIVAFSSSSEG